MRDQHKIFKVQDQSNFRTINYANIRRQISEFLLFLRDSVKRYFVSLYFKYIETINHFIFTE